MAGRIEKDPIDIVVDLMIDGMPTPYIIEHLESKQIPKDEMALIIEQALAKFVKSARMPATVRKGWCLEALRELYRLMIKAEDYGGALGALKEIAKLSALYTSNNSDEVNADIDAYIDEVLTLS